jgi:hypothetical protein
MTGDPSVITTVSKSAMSATASPRVAALASPRSGLMQLILSERVSHHAYFLSTSFFDSKVIFFPRTEHPMHVGPRDVITTIPKRALTAEASDRTLTLSTVCISSKTSFRFSSHFSLAQTTCEHPRHRFW